MKVCERMTGDVWESTGRFREDGDDERDTLVQLVRNTYEGKPQFLWVSQADIEDAWFIVNQ